MSIKNLSIAKKISLSFLLIAIVKIAFGVFLSTELKSIKSELLNYTDDTLPAMERVDSIRDHLSRWRRAQFAAYTYEDADQVKTKISNNIREREKITRELNAYGETIWPGEEQQTYQRLMRQWKKYLVTMDQYNEAMLANDKSKAHPILANSLSAFEAVDSELGELIRLLKEAMDSNKTHILSSVNGLSNSSIASNVIILLIMVGMTYVLTRLICGPLKLVVEQANAIATGDLSSDIDRKAIGNDELGELADATTKMQDDLRQVIDNVIAAVTQLSSAVEEMNQISDISASGMKDQQLQITHIATAMTEMKAAVADVARNTEDSANQANEANRRTQHGVRETQGMVDAIQEVSNVIGAAGDTVAELEQQSNKINVIVDVIRDIADQTNLLALNAAIEAARAGESGRGFAVVADEVRTLAGRTQDSTSEITSIIEQLQSLAKDAKSATELSRTSISECAEQGIQSKQLMSDIEHSISDISDMGTQIATACNQQDSVAEELNRSIENIHLASQEVSQGSEQTAQACRELSQLSISLKDVMSRFKLS
ncbi:methyl-accepting chemotaxis protein [Vibrio alginolyticus]|uniref:methyl-accepting chemotaxis protein n=1 Tax=Vibrio alginolyticus TaxID=663 RepID=UPI00215C93A9|nr:methyl-accepting chemotaxis protein [Vibrio alginolyticus]MCR9562308.1 methyl-accepting chemotaxis protein [Vibrio alginolyticus]